MWECPKCGRKFKNTNQSHYCGTAPQSIEEYIAQQPKMPGRISARSMKPSKTHCLTLCKKFHEYADLLEKSEPDPVCSS